MLRTVRKRDGRKKNRKKERLYKGRVRLNLLSVETESAISAARREAV